MKPTEVGAVLTTAAAFDYRQITPEIATVTAQALADDMPVDWAVRYIPTWYASNSQRIMPADLNTAWAREKDRRLKNHKYLEPPPGPISNDPALMREHRRLFGELAVAGDPDPYRNAVIAMGQSTKLLDEYRVIDAMSAQEYREHRQQMAIAETRK